MKRKRDQGEVTMANFSNVQHGCLEIGTATDFGRIERTSLTAYLIGGRWMSWDKVHGPYLPVEPLVSFA